MEALANEPTRAGLPAIRRLSVKEGLGQLSMAHLGDPTRSFLASQRMNRWRVRPRARGTKHVRRRCKAVMRREEEACLHYRRSLW